MADSSPTRSKIGALPIRTREQLNHRLLDGQVDSEILPWINELPETKKRLEERFKGEPISPQNLSAWRNAQYKRWLDERKELENTQALAEFAAGLAEAAGGNLSAGAKALATGRVMAQLQTLGPDEPKALMALVKATTGLSKADAEAARLALDQIKSDQAERDLRLREDKFRRETATLFIDYIADQRAREIAESGEAKEVKMDQLIKHIWGERPGN